jgi:subtilisin family serine protease
VPLTRASKEYELGSISSSLIRYREAVATSGSDPLRVVVALRQAPEADVVDLSIIPRRQSEAMELLRSTGIGGDVLTATGIRPRRILAGLKTVTADIPAGQLESLASSPSVEYVRPVRWHRMHLDASAPLLGVDASVRSRFTGRGVRVAVIDSGIDASHPDLTGRVDLARSRNFTSEGDPDDVTDHHGHGTHVAGIIGGAGNQFRGVAPEVEFIVCKVFDGTGQATEEGAVIEAVRWAVSQGADIINYSGGFAPVYQGVPLIAPPWVWPDELLEEEQEFQRAVEAGVVAVVSAGNEGALGHSGTLSLPATCSAVISVGAISKLRQRSSFSSAGPSLRSPAVPPFEMVASLSPVLEPVQQIPKVDLVAPGGEVEPTAVTMRAV